ncbi:MAG: hypothetical protein KDK08_29425 [Rhizobiaceae bacterium]|nr:hypothetical protein [Rhizobiaceae bacterium]
MTQFLIIGRKIGPIEEAIGRVGTSEAVLHAATGFDEARAVLTEHPVDAIIMGAGLDLDERLDIVRFAFERSDRINVHMKDRATGPAGFPDFVAALVGLHAERASVSSAQGR